MIERIILCIPFSFQNYSDIRIVHEQKTKWKISHHMLKGIHERCMAVMAQKNPTLGNLYIRKVCDRTVYQCDLKSLSYSTEVYHRAELNLLSS